MEYNVTAQAFNRKTGVPSGISRVEKIVPANNSLFTGCKTIMAIKTAYESFWNDLNPRSEDVVFVSNVTPV